MRNLSLTILIFILVLFGGYYFLVGKAIYPSASASPLPSSSAAIDSNIQVTQPKMGDIVSSPFVVVGKARVFESQFNYRLRDANGLVLAEGSAHADAPDAGQFGSFAITITFPQPKVANGILEVFDYSAKDGRQIDTVSIPLRFEK